MINFSAIFSHWLQCMLGYFLLKHQQKRERKQLTDSLVSFKLTLKCSVAFVLFEKHVSLFGFRWR